MLVIIILLILILANNIIATYFILKAMKKTNKTEIQTVKRKHTTIKTSNYNNSFNARGYDIYKNEKTGLYEPQKPHQGIELKKQKED